MRAKAVAVRLLARREHSAYEITQKLAMREFEPDEIAQTVAELKQGGWLSDERFAEAYIRLRRMKGFGPIRIKVELQERGVDAGIVEQRLNRNSDEWFKTLQQQYEKKYRNKAMTDYAEKTKRIRFLQYRGFDLDVIHHLLN